MATALTFAWFDTPGHFRSRVVLWEVRVEEPISFEPVEALMNIFVEEAEDVLQIRTHGITYSRADEDGRDNYTEWQTPVQYAGWTGPIHVTVSFLTGTGWRPDERRPTLARGQLGPRSTTWWGNGLNVGIEYYSTVERCCSVEQIHTLIHEFAHNLGLKDLYASNQFGIGGCENLPIFMSAGALPNPEDRAPTGALVFRREATNETASVIEVTETYYDSSVRRLTRSYYSVLIDEPPSRAGWYNESYDLRPWREAWTQQQLRYLGLPGTSPYSCPQEGLP